MALTGTLRKTFILILVCGLIAAWIGSSVLMGISASEHRGYWFGVAVGYLTCFGSLYALWMILLWTGRRTHPPLPLCRTGMCAPKDYRWEPDPRVPGDFLARCRCGGTYKRLNLSWGHERFVEVDAEGRILPYMAHGPWKSWKPE